MYKFSTIYPKKRIYSLFDEKISSVIEHKPKEIKMPEEYPKTVLIQPTQEFMNHNGYFNDENQSEQDIDEYDFVLGTKRKEFILENSNSILPQGYEVVNNE